MDDKKEFPINKMYEEAAEKSKKENDERKAKKQKADDEEFVRMKVVRDAKDEARAKVCSDLRIKNRPIAKAEADKRNFHSTGHVKLCPLTVAACDHNCVCWHPSKAIERGKSGIFDVSYAYCGNKMFFGGK